ncbi:hypothetical protein FRC02_003791 [Tulasnella sp. 418]|nr:hypothetical protein FRC02_003791 [Tulasnella sp. 418]
MTGSESDTNDDGAMSIPGVPGGIFNLPAGSELIRDVEEEIFLLYTRLKTKNSDISDAPLGLGSVDSKISEITVTIDLVPPPSTNSQDLPKSPSPSKEKSPKRSRATYYNRLDKKRQIGSENKTVEIVLEQDPSSLRSRKGDTGSVLWRASVHLARYLLMEHHFPPQTPLLSPPKLKSARVLELGAGVGFLATLLSPLVEHYTVTDIGPLLPLIRKNVIRNLPSTIAKESVTVAELDWLDIQQASTPSWRQKLFPTLKEDNLSPLYDLIICCDCIYNTSLVPPLVATINHCCSGVGSVVLVVVELREEDVLREFLTAWLDSDLPRIWKVWRIPEDKLGFRTVGWIGWKESEEEV